MAKSAVSRPIEQHVRPQAEPGVPASSLLQTCELLKEAVNLNRRISIAEKANIHRLIRDVRDSVSVNGISPAERHMAFREELIRRSRASRKMDVLFLKFKRLLSRRATNRQIDDELEKSLASETEMAKVVSSIHAGIVLRHFDDLRKAGKLPLPR